MLLGVDVGGTFTDAVIFDGRALHAAKAPTTPDDQSRGVLAAVEPAPLIQDELRLGARERTGADGVIDPLGDDELERLSAAVRKSGADSVAVCLLFSYLDPSHERAIAERLRVELPELHVSASHEVLPQFREYERCSTTVIDAYLSPLLGRYLERLSATGREHGLPEPMVMKSSGGVEIGRAHV